MNLKPNYTKQDCIDLWSDMIKLVGPMREDITPTYWNTVWIYMNSQYKTIMALKLMDSDSFVEQEQGNVLIEQLRNNFKCQN